MPKYQVEIIEKLSRVVEIEAKDSDEAYELIHEQYRHEEIVLNNDDYQDTEIDVLSAVEL